MRRSMGMLATAITAILLNSAVGSEFASAQNVHLKQNRNPTFIDQGTFLNAQGALAGLGGGDVFVHLDARADVTSTCTSPGGNVSPGQNPADVTVTGSQAIPQERLKNGSVPFNVTTQAPTSPVPGAPSCPNPNWTETISDLSFTSATLTVQQAGAVVLIVNCDFTTPTTNGAVSRNNVTCTQD